MRRFVHICLLAAALFTGMTGFTKDHSKLIAKIQDKWRKHLSKTEWVGKSKTDVLNLFKSRYVKKAEVPLGGSGRYNLYLLIDDFTQIKICFDVKDKVILSPVVEQKQKWVKSGKGKYTVRPLKIETDKPTDSIAKPEKKKTDEPEKKSDKSE